MTARPTSDDFRGISAVTVTPFLADGSAVDESGVGTIVTSILRSGIDLVVPCGNTGEYHALTEAERRLVAELTLAAVSDHGRGRVIVGVGGALPDAIRAARHASDHGAVAVMVHHPAHPNPTEEGLLAYYAAIADGSGLPIVPYVKSTTLGERALQRLVERPEVPAVKYAINDVQAFGRAVELARGRADVAWICGTAESWAPFFWTAGAVGFTSGLVNVTAIDSIALLRALETGDRAAAMARWARIRPFEQLRSRAQDGYNIAVVKEALRQLGLPAGPVRPPASDVGDEERSLVAACLSAWGLVAREPVAGEVGA